MAATRSTCLRRKVGAVLVRDRSVISTGYNGAPRGVSHCETCLRVTLEVPSGERHELCMGAHAEANAIAQAARMGVSTLGATLYSTTEPCVFCTKMIINSGVTRVVFEDEYRDELARMLRREAGLRCQKLNREDGANEEA